MGQPEIESIYTNPDFHRLHERNRHFSMLDAYDRIVQLDGVTQQYEEEMYTNFKTALVEDFTGGGGYVLILYPGQPSRFSTADHKNSDVVELAHRAWQKRKIEGSPFERELAEAEGAQLLKDMCEQLPIGSHVIWTSPPGAKENGYRWQVSITYFGTVEEFEEKKQLSVKLFVNRLSLLGHGLLLQNFTSLDPSEVTEHFLVSHHFDISQSSIQTAEELFARVNELETLGHVNPDADIRSFLSEQSFYQRQPQIDESFGFLLDVMKMYYARSGIALGQEELSHLEVAYEFAYRAVLQYSDDKRLIPAASIWQDFLRKIEMQKIIEQTVGVVDSKTARQAYLLQKHYQSRYREIGPREVGGAVCPSGLVEGLGFGDLMNSITNWESSGYKGSWRKGSCICCGKIETDVGDCSVCRKCQYEFDMGIRS